MSTLTEIMHNAEYDLHTHRYEFDAIVCGGDPHATAIGAALSAALNLPLMIVCVAHHECRMSDITCIGDVDPRQRFLYVDDWFSFGATLKQTFDYMNQSRHANIVATYEANTRTYETL